MKDLLFDVEKVPIKDLGIALPAMPNISQAIVGNGKILNFCSEDYELITNESILARFESFLKDEGLDYTFHYQAYGSVRFKFSFYLKNHETEMGRKNAPDLVAPALYVWNSYNGSLRFQFGVQLMRQICTNGLTALIDVKSLRMLHTSGSVDAIPQSLKMLAEFEHLYKDIIEPFEDLKLFPVKDIDFRIDTVVENTPFPVWLGDLAKDRAHRESTLDGIRVNDWLIYNSMNYVLNHNADHLLGRKADNIDREVLTFLLEG